MASYRDCLMEIYNRHGRLTPELVVEAARPKSHPLHHVIFNLPVREAAEAYYLDRARKVLQVTFAQRDENEGETRVVRAFYALSVEGNPNVRTYEPISAIAADPLKETVWRADMERQIRGLASRFDSAVEFLEFARCALGVDEREPALAA